MLSWGLRRLKNRLQIQPFVGPTADCTVIEIEAVYVDNGAVGHAQDKKEGQSYRLPEPALVCRGVVHPKDRLGLPQSQVLFYET